MTVPAGGGSLAEQPAARALLTVLAVTADGLDAEQALGLLTGPIGRLDRCRCAPCGERCAASPRLRRR
ncbi:hypothetical protein I552_9293 [Mycobacterium xenopi 3993]|nr:hypothetical protein I552_9293 [Mycobacterium xenopi 3993]